MDQLFRSKRWMIEFDFQSDTFLLTDFTTEEIRQYDSLKNAMNYIKITTLK
ncbi:MAG: hypothetical protein WC549_09430 [Actinomycetota bacterium]